MAEQTNIRIIGIIPARGGSKGLPGKNLKLINGKPLIAWTIIAAKKSKLLKDFFVSTEDSEIKSTALSYGAKVIDRPTRLATDTASILDVCYHAAKKTRAEVIMLLQPTSPVRSEGLIDNCIRTFNGLKADSLATGFVCKYIPYGTQTTKTRRQDLKGFFYDDGNIYIIKTDLLRRGLKKGRKAIQHHTSKEENVEIDEEYDFWLAEKIMKERKI